MPTKKKSLRPRAAGSGQEQDDELESTNLETDDETAADETEQGNPDETADQNDGSQPNQDAPGSAPESPQEDETVPAEETPEFDPERPWTATQPKDGVTVGPGEQMNVQGWVISNQVHLTSDVYQAILPQGSQRWIFRQRWVKGQVVPLAQITNSGGVVLDMRPQAEPIEKEEKN